MPRPPGQVGPNVQPQVRMMLCTAGHVDHGKTKLVRLLTGCRTDKLKTEIERGLTIELGFAPCLIDAGDGLSIGIVDVPGHEKFIRNMVAGVSGIEMAILVVAADDGVMPQTVEHVQIMELLGVRDGIVVLNKTDLVDEELLELQMEDLKEFLKGTFLKNAPICPLSSETFDGYCDFYDILVEKVKAAGAREREADPRVFRLPVERTFTKAGFGTVVTGIPVSGKISIGTPIEVVPGNLKGKVRTIQCFLRDAETAERGKCCALNIGELDRDEVARGSVVATRGYFTPSNIIHVRAVNVPNLERPMKNGEQIRFHAGTSEAHGKLYLLKELESGEWYATLTLQDPVVAATGDRFLIRRPSENRTIGGGEILRVDAGKNRPRKAVIVPELERIDAVKAEAAKLGLAGSAAAMIHALRVDARTQGAGIDALAITAQLPQEAAEAVLSELLDRDLICELPGRQFMDTAIYKASKAEAARRVQMQVDAGEVVVRQNEIREGLDWPPHLWRAILAELEGEGMFERNGDRLVLSSGLDGLSQSDRKIAEKIIEVYQESMWATPRPEELPDKIHASTRDADRLIEYLCEQNELVRLSKNVLFSMDNFRKAQDMVVELIQREGSLESGSFKNKINSTRKYALAFLDYLDGRRITVRIGNDRKLSRDYERNLI